MGSTEKSESVAAAHWDKRYVEQVRSAWFSNRLVLEELNRRITGINKFWLAWVFEDLLTYRPKRVLSIGCGDGAHELIIARHRWAEHVDAFDASAAGIEIAKKAVEDEGLNASFTLGTFESFISSPVTQVYDLVMFIGSLHHVRELEPMLDKVKRTLTADGLLMINEYVGPCYNIYDAARIDIMNRLLSSLAPEFTLTPTSQWTNLEIEAVLSADPSESTRSALIPAFLNYYFRPRVVRNFGGALLHPLFDHLNSARLNDGSPESDAIVRLLIQTENLLTEAGALPQDFCFGLFCPWNV
jgi:ubiquinone/menaquinone biosynthesis C-methylase UbiE